MLNRKTFCNTSVASLTRLGYWIVMRPFLGEKFCALLTSQIVSFSGSSSIEILRALIDGLGGVWEIGSVPVGVFDDTCLRRWKDGGSVAGRFALQNINSSAFEIYGTPIREAVVRAQLRRDAIDLVFCGSLIEGHGGLPIIMSYSELGPIINTDSFVWRSNANSEVGRNSSPGVRIARDCIARGR